MVYYLITQSSINDRDKERYGINFFLKKRIKVIVLDVQDYTNPELIESRKKQYTCEHDMTVINCQNLKTLKNTLDIYGKGLALLVLSDNIQSTRIRRYIKNKNVKIGIIETGMSPLFNKEMSIFTKIKNKFLQQGAMNFFKLLTNKIFTKFMDIKDYDFLVVSNYSTFKENYAVKQVASIIETHCSDYDVVLKCKTKQRLIGKKYVVFLDQNLIRHSDFIRENSVLSISEDTYFNELNNFFKKIEMYYNCEVVIASHPSANSNEYKTKFNQRKIFNNDTALLIKYCEFSIAHYSTSINFSVIYNKPILFITSNAIKKSFINKYIVEFSFLLNQIFLNISELEKYPLEMKIDKKKYDDYRKKYIKNNKLEIDTWKTFYNKYARSFYDGR